MPITKLESDFVHKVLTAMPSPVFVKDRNHRFILLNQAMCDLMGRSAEELIGKSDYDFFTPKQADVFWSKDEEVFNSKQTVQNEEDLTDSAGKVHWLVTKKSCFGDGEEAILVGIIHDITAQKELELSLERAKTDAEEISRLKSTFVANVSHEIRTPMNGVLGMSELLLETRLTSEQKEYVECLIASGKTLLSVVNDVLDFSKVESGKMDVTNEPFSIREMVGALEHMFRSQFFRRKVDFFCEVADDIPHYLIGDAGRLLQVLTNLVSNSLKFTLPEGMVWVALRAEDFNGRKVLASYVFDSGIGIPTEKQKLVFDPFTQVDAGISRSFGGTGLGLSIVSKLVELMDGEVVLRSRQRVGTMVRITVPLQKAVESAAELGRQRLYQSSIHRSDALKILVAEDNKVNQLLISRILEREGYHATFVENGEEALRLNAINKFDLILMDIQMPILDGQAATQLIRRSRINNNVPIIALTANAFRSDAEKYFELGMNGHVAKPISRADLSARYLV